MDHVSDPGEEREIPYHALLCEVLSSILGVKCCARLFVASMLRSELGRDILEGLLDSDFDEGRTSPTGESFSFLMDQIEKFLRDV